MHSLTLDCMSITVPLRTSLNLRRLINIRLVSLNLDHISRMCRFNLMRPLPYPDGRHFLSGILYSHITTSFGLYAGRFMLLNHCNMFPNSVTSAHWKSQGLGVVGWLFRPVMVFMGSVNTRHHYFWPKYLPATNC